ncbi:MAG: DEAD/DEAH box helicase [Planctomycetes bacterium]|nr:DEAD/DEAH box helicase [Planctomycetota bacterium]
MTQFASLHLSAPLLRALDEEGYVTPTPIQAQAIPSALQGRDVLGCAQTGTGKTAAFALPILERLLASPGERGRRRGSVLPRVLVLAPTRELASQIGESFDQYARYTGCATAVVYGGVSQFHQVRALERGADVLVATPGRLIDLMQQRLVDLHEIAILVLDEADRMLDMGFLPAIKKIVGKLPPHRQTMLFSATMPKEITHLAEALLKNPVRVSVAPSATPVERIEQSVYMISRSAKPALLHHLLLDSAVERAVVFTRTKHGADRLSKRLKRAGVSAEAIHGDKAQNQRERALDAFRTGRSRVLVATDVAARGLDVDGVTHVFNFDLPNEPEAYVHRIGRTGRAGSAGAAVAFCDSEERPLLRDIEKLTSRRIAMIPVPPMPNAAAMDPGPSRAEGAHHRPAGPSHGAAGQGFRAHRPSRGPRRSWRAQAGRG